MVKLLCKKCNDIIEGDGKGTYIQCECKSCAIDETPWYCRFIGNPKNYVEVQEEIEVPEEFEKKKKQRETIMNINIFQNYKVTITTTSSYVSQEDSTPTDWAYRTITGKTEHIIDGGILVTWLYKYFRDRCFMSVDFEENSIHIELFDPMNGTGDDITIEIESADEHVSL